jgi:uncharacterized repeat protein (TIGR01451 family)
MEASAMKYQPAAVKRIKNGLQTIPYILTAIIVSGVIFGIARAEPVWSQDSSTINDFAYPSPEIARPPMVDTILADDGDDLSDPGETIEYSVLISNTGVVSVTNVSFTATLDTNLDYVSGTVNITPFALFPTADVEIGAFDILQGESVTLTFQAVLTNPLPAGVEGVCSQGWVTAAGGIHESTYDPDAIIDPTCTEVDAAPMLSLLKDDGGITIEPGDTLTYVLTVANPGNQDATGVVITETVPAYSIFNAAASSPGWVCVPGRTPGSLCILQVGALAGGGSQTTNIFAVDVVAPLPAGVQQIQNQAKAADDGSNGGDPYAEAGATTLVMAAPDLVIQKRTAQDLVEPGTLITYTLTYSNVGTQGATGVIISDTVPENTSFIQGSSTPGWSCVDGSPAGTVCNFPLGELPVGGANSVVFGVEIDAVLPPGVDTIVNVAEISDDVANGPDLDASNNLSMAYVGNAIANLALTKTASDELTLSGAQLAYTLTVFNAGPLSAVDSILLDTVPEGTALLEAPEFCSNVNGVIRCNLGTISPGNSRRVILTLIVSQDFVGTVTNQASVSSSTYDSDPLNNTASESVRVIAEWIFADDFENIVADEWCGTPSTSISPSGEYFLGEFTNEMVCLFFDGLPPHTVAYVEFDLYLIRSWDGNIELLENPPLISSLLADDLVIGPDIWQFQVDGKRLLDTTFSNWDGLAQAFPGWQPGSAHTSMTGASAVDTLGYDYNDIPMDSTYHLNFLFNHTGRSMLLEFIAHGLQAITDESWGLDNVRVILRIGNVDQVYLPILLR